MSEVDDVMLERAYADGALPRDGGKWRHRAEADEREQYRREALADARADREAQQHGYDNAEAYQAALVWDGDES